MSTRARMGLLLLFASATCAAAELSPFLSDRQVGVRVTHVNYPENLRKDLTSGLTNTLLIRMSLLADAQVVRQRTATLTVKYDLWEETFAATLSIEGANVDSTIYGTLADVTAALAQLELPGVFRSAELPAARKLVIRAEMLLNPLDRERMEKIRKWVAENSTYAPPGRTGVGTLSPVGTGSSNSVFNKIFEQYAAGANVAAAWTENGTSKPFQLEELRDERP
jgi:hypothetical protein